MRALENRENVTTEPPTPSDASDESSTSSITSLMSGVGFFSNPDNGKRNPEDRIDSPEILIHRLGLQPEEVVQRLQLPGRSGHQTTVAALASEVGSQADEYVCWNPSRRVEEKKGGWLDITRVVEIHADVDGPKFDSDGDRTGGMPDLDSCFLVVSTLSDMLGSAPAGVIRSGGGLQPIWAFDEQRHSPAETRDLLHRWDQLVQTVGKSHGGVLDRGIHGDIARQLRVPGTINFKPAYNRPLVVIEHGLEYRAVTFDQLEEVLDSYVLPVTDEQTVSKKSQKRSSGAASRLLKALQNKTLSPLDILGPDFSDAGKDESGRQFFKRNGSSQVQSGNYLDGVFSLFSGGVEGVSPGTYAPMKFLSLLHFKGDFGYTCRAVEHGLGACRFWPVEARRELAASADPVTPPTKDDTVTDPYRVWLDQEGSITTGGVKRADVGVDGAAGGELVEVMKKDTRAITRVPVDVTARLIDDEGVVVGYEIRFERDEQIVTDQISPMDLSTRGRIAQWNISRGLFQTEVGHRAEAWFRWAGSPISGVPTKFAVYAGQGSVQGTEILVGTDGDLLWASDNLPHDVHVLPTPLATLLRREATSEQLAADIWRLMTFRRLEESVPTMAAISALATPGLSELLTGRAIRLVEITGTSGRGKTPFLRLALQQFGCTAQLASSISVAAFRRQVGFSHVPYGLDDISATRDAITLADDFRGLATGGSAIRANMDDQGATLSRPLRSGVILAVESSVLGDTVAEMERRVDIQFIEDPSGRREPDGSSQYLAMHRHGAEHREGPSRANLNAGPLMAEVCQYLWDMVKDPAKQPPEWIEGIGRRGDATIYAVHANGLALTSLLRRGGLVEEAEEAEAALLEWVRERTAVQVETHRSGTALSSVRALEVYLQSSPVKRTLGYLLKAYTMDEPLTLSSIKELFRNNTNGSISEWPPVVPVTTPDGIMLVVHTQFFHGWTTSDESRKAGLDKRLGGRNLSVADIKSQLGNLPGSRSRRLDLRTRSLPNLPTGSVMVFPVPSTLMELLGINEEISLA